MIYGYKVKYNGRFYNAGEDVPVVSETPDVASVSEGNFQSVEVERINTTPKETKPKSVAKTQSTTKKTTRR